MYHASKKQKPRDFISGAVACQSRLNQQTVTFIFYGHIAPTPVVIILPGV